MLTSKELPKIKLNASILNLQSTVTKFGPYEAISIVLAIV